MRRKNLAKAINLGSTHVAKLTKEKLRAMASTYVSETDFDGNERLDKAEFTEFFLNFNAYCLQESEINILFDKFKGRDGSLTVEQFAECLFECLIPEGLENME